MRALAVVFLVACSGPSSETGDTSEVPATDFGGEDIALDADCQGIAGLTAQAVLDRTTAGGTSTLAYVTADAEFVDPTELTVQITWPTSPSATCYPAWDEAPLYAAAERVGIPGLTLAFTTADGHFDESLPATAWFLAAQGIPQQAVVSAATTYERLDGDWVPFPEYGDGTGTTIDIAHPLADPPVTSGLVGMGGVPLDRLQAGVFGSRFAVASWPH